MSSPNPSDIEQTNMDTPFASHPSVTMGGSYLPAVTVVVASSQPPDAIATLKYDPASNPFERFIGSFHSGLPDLAANHDRYLAEEYGGDDSTE